VWEQFGIKKPLKIQRIDELRWGGLPVGSELGELKPIFPRIDKKVILERILRESEEPVVEDKAADASVQSGGEKKGKNSPAAVAASTATQATRDQTAGENKITIEEFAKVDLRVAQVISAERVQGADKLLKLIVDLGTEKRQILAGIAKVYSPESMIGRKIIVVANLHPRKMRGLESNGMLLAASLGEEGNPVLAGFLEDVPNGAKLK
jgi:methionyl-tRNA synthetase